MLLVFGQPSCTYLVRSGRHGSTFSVNTPWSIGASRLQTGQRNQRGNGATGTPELSPSGTTGGVSSCSTCDPTAARTAASSRGSETGSPSARGQSSSPSTSVVSSGSSTVAPTP